MIYFTAHTINCVCHSIRTMFRVLDIYNFGSNEKREVMRFLTVAVTIRLSDSDLSRLEKPPYTQQKRDIFPTFHMCL